MDTIGSSGHDATCIPTFEEVAEFRRVVNTVIGKWKIDILFVLLAGPKRFGELRRTLSGITQDMLTAQLRALEAGGLVRRTAFANHPAARGLRTYRGGVRTEADLNGSRHVVAESKGDDHRRLAPRGSASEESENGEA